MVITQFFPLILLIAEKWKLTRILQFSQRNSKLPLTQKNQVNNRVITIYGPYFPSCPSALPPSYQISSQSLSHYPPSP